MCRRGPIAGIAESPGGEHEQEEHRDDEASHLSGTARSTRGIDIDQIGPTGLAR
jgi:hypothetical protein